MSHKKYIIECRKEDGTLDFEREPELRKAHPFLFSKPHFSMDSLCWWMSYGEKRNKPSGPQELPAFMKSIGASYREKTW